MKAWTRRDLTIVPVNQQKNIVIACDSCGAIGKKDGDIFKLPPRYAGKFTARVALTEVLCSGATPITITNGVSCEMNPTGEKTILGIYEELRNAGITDIVLTGSTEENFVTNMTALAITVIGIAKKNDLKFGCAVKGDSFLLLGTPRVGDEVDLESVGFYSEINELLQMQSVKEIIPVGSRGIAYEAEMVASLGGMAFKSYKTGVDYFKSAGPATCLLILCAKPAVNQILNKYPSAVLIGEIL